MKYRVLLVFTAAVLIVLLTVYASTPGSRKRAGEKSYPTAMRLIGHNLLLSAGDTQSRVMPVKQLPGEKFQIYFENQLSLEPDSIFNIITRTAKQYSLADAYTADVLECSDNNEIVYSFVMSPIDSNIIVPCIGRTLPKGCYYIQINFTANQLLASKRIYVWSGAILFMLLAYLIYFHVKSKRKNIELGKKDDSTTRAAIPIGEFSFCFNERQLQINGDKIELTDKESKLLHILAIAPNTTIDREQLQKEVWGNEGVIVTRSLDVFISRLRKRLEKDPNVRLVNVHSKGYKLEMPKIERADMI